MIQATLPCKKKLKILTVKPYRRKRKVLLPLLITTTCILNADAIDRQPTKSCKLRRSSSGIAATLDKRKNREEKPEKVLLQPDHTTKSGTASLFLWVFFFLSFASSSAKKETQTKLFRSQIFPPYRKMSSYTHIFPLTLGKRSPTALSSPAYPTST